jgi:hypothetical protein
MYNFWGTLATGLCPFRSLRITKLEFSINKAQIVDKLPQEITDGIDTKDISITTFYQ